VRLHAGTPQFFDDKAPTRRALEGEGGRLPAEGREKRPHLTSRRGPDLTANLLSGAQVDIVICDLRTMYIKSSYDSHGDLLWLHVLPKSTHVVRNRRT
jgi:hypothetical protein